jgi:hypothetical protein
MLWAAETFGLGTIAHEVPVAPTAGPAPTAAKVAALTRSTKALPNPMKRPMVGMHPPSEFSVPGT